jgi:transglutaminase-like putative cysteine protease
VGRAWLVGALILVACYRPAAAEPTEHARLDHLAITYDVHHDLTYVQTIEADYTLRTARGIRDRERSTMSFYPKSQDLEVLEAWVEQPDGERIEVGPSMRFTRPSEAAQNAPGFTSALTTTLLYPQLHEGSHTHVKWRLTQKTPPMLGFNVWAEPPLEWPVGEAIVTITAPADLKLEWRARGGFEVKDEGVTAPAADGKPQELRRITAEIHNTKGEEPERDMVAPSDFQPLFLATTLPSLAEIGAIYHSQAEGKAVVTPEISALATKIADGRTGLDAARAVYDWVAGNIRYVAVYLDPNDGWVPHPAAEVLHNGYGDCKDHVVLMQALLGALGIRAEAAVVDWGSRTRDLPLWVPQFNHAIVYLPDYDRYANPTNAYARFDSLDRKLAGKAVVIATEEGRVAHTPPPRPEDNRYRLDAKIAVDADGQVNGAATLAMSANLESMARSAVAGASSTRDLAERLLSGTPEGGFGQLSTSNPRDLSHPFSMVATWQSPHGVTFAGQEAYMQVPAGLDIDPPSQLRAYLSPNGTRRHGLIAAAGDYTWATTLTVPPGMTIARMPADVSLHNSAGSYAATYERSGRDLRVVRHLVVARGVYEAEEYPELARLLYAPIDDARAVLVLQRAEAAAE